MGPIEPIRPVRLVKRERKAAEETTEPQAVNLTINVAAPAPPEPPRLPTPPAPTAEAHLIAQNARARGLRGGQQVLSDARAAYLQTEYAGPNDRRSHAGEVTKKDV
ncbi:MAG TPA: hypothetical protein VGL58_05895 [Caulobacteraceae bacterium]|jgi:hypothetical protein